MSPEVEKKEEEVCKYSHVCQSKQDDPKCSGGVGTESERHLPAQTTHTCCLLPTVPPTYPNIASS